MNLNRFQDGLGRENFRVSIPIRDLMNLNPVGLCLNQVGKIVSIPIRDLMNLNLHATTMTKQ